MPVTHPPSLADDARQSANERNMLNLYHRLTELPGLELFETREYTRIRCDYPHPLVNTIIATLLSEESAESALDECTEYYDSRNLPFSWMVSTGSRPTDLRHRLGQRGMKENAAMLGMTIELTKWTSPTDSANSVAAVRIERVESSEQLEHWIAASAKGSGMPEDLLRLFSPLICQGTGQKSDSLQAYTAYLNNQPVGTSMLNCDGSCAGIYCVAVVSEARRKGVGRAVTAHALAIAKAEGYTLGALQASAMGEPLYRRMGFTSQGKFEIYSR